MEGPDRLICQEVIKVATILQEVLDRVDTIRRAAYHHSKLSLLDGP